MDSNDNSYMGWVLAGVASIVGTLSTVVAYLFRKSEFDNAQAIKKLEEHNAEVAKKADDCEKDRTTLFATCEVLKVKVENLETTIKLKPCSTGSCDHIKDTKNG